MEEMVFCLLVLLRLVPRQIKPLPFACVSASVTSASCGFRHVAVFGTTRAACTSTSIHRCCTLLIDDLSASRGWLPLGLFSKRPLIIDQGCSGLFVQAGCWHNALAAGGFWLVDAALTRSETFVGKKGRGVLSVVQVSQMDSSSFAPSWTLVALDD